LEFPKNGQRELLQTRSFPISFLIDWHSQVRGDFNSGHNCPSGYLHWFVPADSRYYVTDPEANHVPVKELLSKVMFFVEITRNDETWILISLSHTTIPHGMAGISQGTREIIQPRQSCCRHSCGFPRYIFRHSTTLRFGKGKTRVFQDDFLILIYT